MARTPPSSKHTRRRTRFTTQHEEDENDQELLDELLSDDGDDEQAQQNNAKFIATVQKTLEQKGKKITVHSTAFQTRKNTLYSEARKNAKEIVNAGVSALEDIELKLTELRAQEVGFEKYYQDCHLPTVAQQQSFDQLNTLYPVMLQDLGSKRAKQMDDATGMLRNNAPRRRDALVAFSKSARFQLEQAKQKEKDAVDAEALIKHVKNLLRA